MKNNDKNWFIIVSLGIFVIGLFVFLQSSITGYAINPPISLQDWSNCELNCSTAACVNGNNTEGIYICLNASPSNAISIGANNQTIDCMHYNMALGEASHHISTNGKNHTVIKNCNITGQATNIIVNGNNTTIINNSIITSGSNGGIQVNGGVDKLNITNNTISTGGNAIIISSGSNDIDIERNNITDAQYCIRIGTGAATNVRITNNIIGSCSRYGIFLDTTRDTVISGNNISGARAGVNFYRSNENITLYDNSIIGRTVQNIMIEKNKDYDGGSLPDLTNCSFAKMWNNTGSNARKIIYYNSSSSLENDWNVSQLILCNASYTNITNVSVWDSNTQRTNGIYVMFSNRTNFTSVNSSNNRYGMYIWRSYNNTIDNSDFINNTIGLFFNLSERNNVSTNNFTYSVLGINVSYHNNNSLFYDNYFDNNTFVVDDNGYNLWNITNTSGINIIGSGYIGGNYWRTYTGGDLGSDGIGDIAIPFNLSGNITGGGDYLPLTTNSISCTDSDGDGYYAEGGGCGSVDCNDSSSSVNPGATENCTNGIDDDCDGLIDNNQPSCACDLLCSNYTCVENNTAGITICLSQNVTITDADDMSLDISANNQILNCFGYKIIGQDGNQNINLQTKTNTTIKNCLIDNIQSLTTSKTNQLYIYNNIFSNIQGNAGIYIAGNTANNTEIYNNSVTSSMSDGILVTTPIINGSIRNNTITGTMLDGIRLSLVSGVLHDNLTIEKNVIYGVGVDGIEMNAINNTKIENNTIYQQASTTKFKMLNSHSNNITGNKFTMPNTYSNDGYVFINGSTLNNFTRNNVTCGEASCWFNNYSSNNTYKENKFFNDANSSTYRAFVVGTSNNSLIYENYFYNAGNTSVSDDGINFWNTTKTLQTSYWGGSYIGGNFYFEYDGIDSDADAIGDTQYNITGGNNIDYLPLLPDNTVPTVTILLPSNITYTSTVVPLTYTTSEEVSSCKYNLRHGNDGWIKNITTDNQNKTYMDSIGYSDYRVIVYCTDLFGNEGTSSPVVFTVSQLSSSSSSSGGGSIPQDQINEQSTPESTFSTTISVVGGEESVVDVTEDKLSVKQVRIKSKVTKTGTINISRVAQEQAEFTVGGSDAVYEYFEVNTDISDDDIESAAFVIKVSKQWYTENNYDISETSVKRYYGGEWTDLETTLDSEDETYYYFTVNTPGFSMFVITSKVVTERALEEENISIQKEIDVEVSRDDVTLIAVLLILLLAGLYFKRDVFLKK